MVTGGLRNLYVTSEENEINSKTVEIIGMDGSNLCFLNDLPFLKTEGAGHYFNPNYGHVSSTMYGPMVCLHKRCMTYKNSQWVDTIIFPDADYCLKDGIEYASSTESNQGVFITGGSYSGNLTIIITDDGEWVQSKINPHPPFVR